MQLWWQSLSKSSCRLPAQGDYFVHKHRPTAALYEAYHTTKGECDAKINGVHYIHTFMQYSTQGET